MPRLPANTPRFLLILISCLFPINALGQTRPPASRLVEPLDETKLTQLTGNTHPLADPEFDRGAAPGNLSMERMLLILKRGPAQEAMLEKLTGEQLDRSSPNFHRWLTPEEFGEQFGPGDSDIQQVTSWLEAHGFRVTHVSAGRTVIEFSGMAAQVNEAFHTAIHKYVVDGEERWANANDPKIPSALTPVVAGVDSLNNFPRHPTVRIVHEFSDAPTVEGVQHVTPQFTFGSNICGQPGICYGLGPADFNTIYNVLPLWNSGIDGTGQAVAIVAGSNINIQDVRDFRNLFGLPAKDPVIILNGPDPGIVEAPKLPEETEADADLEWTGAVAKNATLYLVVSKATNSTSGQDLSAEFIVDNNIAPVLSASIATCEKDLGSAGNQFQSQLWQQAAAQGITVLVATGDNGSAGCDSFRASAPAPATMGLQVNGIASTPFNTAVGGTDFDDAGNQSAFWNSSNDPATQASAKGYIPEMTWNNSCTNAVFGSSLDPETNCNDPSLAGRVRVGGGSGGKSNNYAKPTWQTGPGVPKDGARDIPDVSLFSASVAASGSFYVVCEADEDQDKSGAPCDLDSPFMHFVAAGGTSISVQVFGGIMALINQKTNSRQGNANPTLYGLASQQSAANCSSASPATSCIFNDITVGTISMPCTPGTPDCALTNPSHAYGVLAGYDAGPAYDLATGLGSVNAFNLVNASGWTSTTVSDFTLSSTMPTVMVPSPGSSGTLALTITSVNGFAGTFNFSASSCSALPSGSSCSFGASSATISQANPTATVMVTISTTAASTTVPLGPQRIVGWWKPIEIVVLLCVLCIARLQDVREQRRRCTLAAGLLSCVLVFWAAGCGGGSSGSGGGGGNAGTPTGTTNAVITLTSSGTTHSFIFIVNVQ